jgi:DNA-binding MarR family transcriptional regulator
MFPQGYLSALDSGCAKFFIPVIATTRITSFNLRNGIRTRKLFVNVYLPVIHRLSGKSLSLRISQRMNEDLYNSYSLLLDRTARRVKQYAQQQFNEMGFNITVDQWVVLKNLYEKEGMKQNELAELLFKDNPTLTRIIDLLCEKGLTVRNLHPSDRRSFVVGLTKEGVKKVEQLGPKVKDIRLKAWDGLSDRDFNQFKKVLNTIYQNLG